MENVKHTPTLREIAMNKAKQIYPMANEDDYPENPNVNRLNRSCIGAYMNGYDLAVNQFKQQVEELKAENEYNLDKYNDLEADLSTERNENTRLREALRLADDAMSSVKVHPTMDGGQLGNFNHKGFIKKMQIFYDKYSALQSVTETKE
jgi:hypothetical protein